MSETGTANSEKPNRNETFSDIPSKYSYNSDLRETPPPRVQASSTASEINSEAVSSFENVAIGVGNGESYEPASRCTANTSASVWNIIEHPKSAAMRDSEHEDSNRSPGDNYLVDAMGAGSPENLDDFSRREFYGTSSAMSFVRALLSNFEAKKSNYTFSEGPPKYGGWYQMRRPFGASNSPSEWILPLRRVANGYVERYICDVLPLYPFVHKETFLNTYEMVWKDDQNREEDDLFYCVLNLVFALGVLHSNGPKKKELFAKAEVYFTRCDSKLTTDVMSHGSLILVQVLLLKSQYLQATRRAGECWNVIGLSIRVAQSLGIHLNNVISSRNSLLEQEMCRRLWHGCIMMDTIGSMTFGRPLMGSAAFKVDYPQETDDHLITDEKVTFCSGPSKASFFVKSLHLYEILGELLQKLYLDPAVGRKNMYHDLFSLDEKLLLFEESLPNHLRVGSGINVEPFQRQAIILRARFLHVKIMLYKSVFFSAYTAARNDQGGQRSPLSYDAEACIFDASLKTSFELISLMVDNNKRVPNILPALWYNVFYVYTCSTVLLMGKMQAVSAKSKFVSQIESSWVDATKFLKMLLEESESAAKCLQFLESVNDDIENWELDKASGTWTNGKNQLEQDILLPFAYGESNFFQGEYQFPG